MQILTPASKFLVLDDRVIESIEHVHLKLGKVEKDPHNPLFMEDIHRTPSRPWEARYDNLYPNVLYDEEDGLYKCWYSPFVSCEVSESVRPPDRTPSNFTIKPNRKVGVCYAFSQDGINWVKPELGIVDFRGSSKNNIVMLDAHGAGVFKDTHETDAAKRYKMLFKAEQESIMKVAFSADGLHWSVPVPWPEHNTEADTHNNALWDQETHKYIGFTRTWSAGWFKGQRVVARTESADFIHWSKPEIVFTGRDEHDQLYSMPVFRYANVFIGLPAVFHHGDTSADDWDKVTTELAWSPDTFEWHRVCPGEQLIPLGRGNYPHGEYDCGCIYGPAYPIIRNGEILLYYLGSNGLHTHWREGTFNLARLRLDGFAGYESTGDRGIVNTRIILSKVAQLKVTADIIGSDGSLRVEVLDENGDIVPGFTREESTVIETSVTDGEVIWQGKNLSQLKDRKIALRFLLEKAKLYSFGV
jgi:hypothetical protein